MVVRVYSVGQGHVSKRTLTYDGKTNTDLVCKPSETFLSHKIEKIKNNSHSLLR